MSVVLEKDVTFNCSVDAILHPTEIEEKKRPDKTTEAWTMFRTYIKSGTKYEARVCVGMATPLNVGDEVTIIGDVVDTGTYGIQFQFSSIKKYLPKERNAIVNFFVKNVNGIGATMAEKIVDAIGLDVVEKVREDPKILESINGISAKRAAAIKEQLDAMESSLEELKFFAKTGLGNARVIAVKSTYAELSKERKNPIDVVALIKKNPYKLIEDVKGIGFKVADSVALNIGFPNDDPARIAAGLEYILKEEVDTKGNIWTKRDDVLKMAADKNCLNLPVITVAPVLNDSVANKKLIEEDGRIYLPYCYEVEFEIMRSLKAIQAYPEKIPSDAAIEKGIDRAERVKERTLDEGQREAVRTCIKNNLAIVTGGPGVGKTTTLDIMLYFLENECNMNITMVAPTGRAAKRMTEQTGRSASTIHKLSASKSRDDFAAGTKKQVLVVDESSMVDITTMSMLMKICDDSTKLIFVGDVDQLPSIGPGQILRDMIESDVIATARLTKIHRQSADSHIITNAHLCINGKHLEKEAHADFFIAEREDEAECLKTIVELVTSAYPKRLGIPMSDIQVLAPLRRGALGVNNLNKVLQEAVNPASPSKKEIEIKYPDNTVLFREGDRVIQNKNDYNIYCDNGEKGVYNGEIGTIKKINNYFGITEIVIEFPDKNALYDMKDIRNLSLAYAISVHKSQGSEFKVVILPLFNYSMPTIYNRNLLYTAITRAKAYCCIVGQRITTNKMIHNNKITNRRTTLAARLNGGPVCSTKRTTKTTKKSSKKSTKKPA